MRHKETLLVLLVLTAGTLMAQQPTAKEAKVTPLMSKALADNPGKEVEMITVEYAPGGTDPIHRHNAQAFVRFSKHPRATSLSLRWGQA